MTRAHRRQYEVQADSLEAEIKTHASASAPAILPLLPRFENAIRSDEGALMEAKLRAIGEFLLDYGAGAAWQAMYLRFGLDVTDSEEAWALGERYAPGDESRFVYRDEQAARAAMKRARVSRWVTAEELQNVDHEVANVQVRLCQVEALF